MRDGLKRAIGQLMQAESVFDHCFAAEFVLQKSCLVGKQTEPQLVMLLPPSAHITERRTFAAFTLLSGVWRKKRQRAEVNSFLNVSQ